MNIKLATALLAPLCLLAIPRASHAYIEAPFSLGSLINQSTNILIMRVTKVDREKNLITYAKVADLKGTHPTNEIRHNIARNGFHPREWQRIMAWADVGSIALFLHNGGAGEVCIDRYWYQVYAGDWWLMSHGEPYLCRSYCGKPDRLAGYISAMLKGGEVAVPCMVDGDKNALQIGTAKLQRMKASLKTQDYNATRDFAGWGVEDFRPIADMPGFSHYCGLARISPDAAAVALADYDMDGRVDACLVGGARAVLLQNSGGALNETMLPIDVGAYSADWTDCDKDGRPDLLLATPAGVKVLLNGSGATFKDISANLPPIAQRACRSAAWIDCDNDGRPDVAAADAFGTVRVFRNLPAEQTVGKGLGPWHYIGPFDNTNGSGYDASQRPERRMDWTGEHPGKADRKIKWQQGKFVDGQANDLSLFGPDMNDGSMVYLYREIDFGGAVDLPVSLGSDDGMIVWLNGEKVYSDRSDHGCSPDQARLTLKLKPGPNRLLLKVCNSSGGWQFYFAVKGKAIPTGGPRFEDATAGLGLAGETGPAVDAALAAADINRDGRTDLLVSGANRGLWLNTAGGFVRSEDSGLTIHSGAGRPVFADFDGDQAIDLFVPADGPCRLFRNDGKGRFTDVTAKSGDLAAAVPGASAATWADVNGDGKPDLVISCLHGPNRVFRNTGDGKFAEITAALGLDKRILNSRAAAAWDMNRDGAADMLFANEGQESCVLLGAKKDAE